MHVQRLSKYSYAKERTITKRAEALGDHMFDD